MTIFYHLLKKEIKITKMNYLSKNDGIDHINIYSKGETKLGNMLSNFYNSPVQIEVSPGESKIFQSIEGYWFWLGLSDFCPKRDQLLDLYGWQAKEMGRNLQNSYGKVAVEGFEDKIKSAIQQKIWQNDKLYQLLLDSTLPLTHYYVYGDKVVSAGFEWITQYISYLRDYIQEYRVNNTTYLLSKRLNLRIP